MRAARMLWSVSTGNRGLLRSQADHYVRVLADFHFHSWRRSLAYNRIHGQGIEEAVFHFEFYAAALEHLLRFDGFLSDDVRHGDFAALNGKAHGGECAEEGDGHQDEGE
jgi:hypothetical protein